jgi:hypothetical protein
MIAAGEGDGWEQTFRPYLLEIGWRDGEVFEPPLHLRARQWLVPKFAHGRPDGLCGEQTV